MTSWAWVMGVKVSCLMAVANIDGAAAVEEPSDVERIEIQMFQRGGAEESSEYRRFLNMIEYG